MSDQPNDRRPEEEQLQRVFARMREEDLAHVPPFPALSARRSAGWRVMPVAVTAALAAAAGLWLWLPPGAAPSDDGLLLAEWSAPTTEFLGLDEFGFDLLPAGEATADDELGSWTDFPTDMLMQQADELIGEEMQ